MLIPRDSGAVTDDPSAAIRTPGQRSRCGAPHRARLIVPQVEGFPRRIGQRIVGERRQPVLAAVTGPRERGPGAAHDRAERGIRQHVRPWQRRFAFAVEHDDVLAPVAREAAEPVLHDQRRDRHRCRGGLRRIGVSAERGTSCSSYSQAAGRSSCDTRSPRSPGRTTLATADRRRRSCSGIPSARSRNVPPGFPSQPTQGGSCTRLDSRLCISSR